MDASRPSDTTEYPYYRKLMSLEVRAAIDGAREAGVRDVLVNDAHASMRNILWDDLPGDARMIYGNRKPFSMAEGIDGTFSAAFFTGYHAAAGERDGTLDHTYTSETLYRTRVNGKPCSEAMLNAAVLGTHGVPVVLITGDTTIVEHTKAEMPWITGVAVSSRSAAFRSLDLAGGRSRGHPIRSAIGDRASRRCAALPLRTSDHARVGLRIDSKRRFRGVDPRL